MAQASFFLLIFGFSFCILANAHISQLQPSSATPPRGWNSYDSYSWVISEEEFLQNAELVAQKLLPFGYEYVVVDFLWYRKKEDGASVTASGYDVIDEWGRPIPDPVRWPSSTGGNGFKPIADQVHSMGLKFGIHVMRGISTQAVLENTPIFGILNQTWRARDIALESQRCSWMPQCFMSVDEGTEGGKAFIQSLYDLYASWGVDFVKHDCVFGVNDLRVEEIKTVSQAIIATGRPMLYSISPGVQANPSMASLTYGLVNMYRITGDDWDSWNDLRSHFDVARDFAAAGFIGATSLLGFSWPDLDMLPIGYLTDPGANHGPNRLSFLNPDEQKTQLTLWAMAKSPLMFGGDMINLDNVTLDLITNPVVLEINANSLDNMEVEVPNLRRNLVPFVGLLDCKIAKETMWRLEHSASSEKRSKLCWTHAQVDGCLHWKPLPMLSKYFVKPALSLYTKVSGQALLYDNGQKSCMDAGANAAYRFSQCLEHRNQIWRVRADGKLVSDATRLCAVVDGVKSMDNTTEPRESINIRVWRARGQQGEFYIAIFNLGEQFVDIDLPLAEIMHESKQEGSEEVIRMGNITATTSFSYHCSGHEVWSNEEIAILGDSLPLRIPPHGCRLFSLKCIF